MLDLQQVQLLVQELLVRAWAMFLLVCLCRAKYGGPAMMLTSTACALSQPRRLAFQQMTVKSPWFASHRQSLELSVLAFFGPVGSCTIAGLCVAVTAQV